MKTHTCVLYIRIKMHALNLLSVWMPSPSTLWLKLKYFPLDIQILYLIKMRKPRNSVSLVKRQNLSFSNLNSTLLTQSFHCQQTVWIDFTSDMILPRHFDLHVYEIPKLFQVSKRLKKGCQHPSHKFEIFWQVAQNLISLLLSYIVANMS